MIRSKSVSICNRSRVRLVDSSRNRTFSRGYPNLMPSYGGLVEPRGSSLTPLKSTFNAEHFTCWLSWPILNGFGENHCQRAYYSLKSRKILYKPLFLGTRSFKVIDVGPTESSSAVLVMTVHQVHQGQGQYIKSASICNRSHARV